jgi:hypothetical protein
MSKMSRSNSVCRSCTASRLLRRSQCVQSRDLSVSQIPLGLVPLSAVATVNHVWTGSAARERPKANRRIRGCGNGSADYRQRRITMVRAICSTRPRRCLPCRTGRVLSSYALRRCRRQGVLRSSAEPSSHVSTRALIYRHPDRPPGARLHFADPLVGEGESRHDRQRHHRQTALP